VSLAGAVTRLLDLLQCYQAVLGIVRKFNSAKATEFVEITSQSLKQVRAVLRAVVKIGLNATAMIGSPVLDAVLPAFLV
jgi:hypothetical protein